VRCQREEFVGSGLGLVGARPTLLLFHPGLQ
jgi:hypothetical protein